MKETFKPEDSQQTAEAVAWAAAEEAPLELLGRGSKRDLGRPVQASHGLELSALSGIKAYEPEELVLTAGAGTALAEIEAAVEAQGQMLAFEPPDLGPLYGQETGRGSIGGVLACNLSGPRRIKAGAARDHFLGLEAVTGRGELFKAGGQVVKNVTGYDLAKLMAGSYGTLAAFTEVTLKVLPRPEKTYSVLLFGLDDGKALEAMTRALTSAHEVSGAAHLPAAMARRSSLSYLAEADASVTAIRVEGPGPSVKHRVAALRRELSDLAESEELHSQNSVSLWRWLGAGGPLANGANGEAAIWRISVAPSDAPAVMERVAAGDSLEGFYDWGGGLLWLALPGGEDAGAQRVRAALGPAGGHATLLRAESASRAAVSVFEPLESAKAALTERIKDGFDPRRILNPGRMYAGI